MSLTVIAAPSWLLAAKMDISVKMSNELDVESNKKVINIDIDFTDKIKDIKDKIKGKINDYKGLESEREFLLFSENRLKDAKNLPNEQLLADEKTLDDYNISAGVTLVLVPKPA